MHAVTCGWYTNHSCCFLFENFLSKYSRFTAVNKTNEWKYDVLLPFFFLFRLFTITLICIALQWWPVLECFGPEGAHDKRMRWEILLCSTSDVVNMSFTRAQGVRNRNLNYSTIRNAYHNANEVALPVHWFGTLIDEGTRTLRYIVNRQWHFRFLGTGDGTQQCLWWNQFSWIQHNHC